MVRREATAVAERLVRESIPLTGPLSNIHLCVFDDMGKHTLGTLLDAGAKVTLNSDDPAYLGGYMNDNIRAVQAAFNFDAATWKRLALNSFEASFVGEEVKGKWAERVEGLFADVV